MVRICELFALEFDITFNCRKTVCIKFGEPVKDCEHIYLNNKAIDWVDSIRHLGNFIDKSLTDEIDIKTKMSHFIGYVNKLIANFSHLQIPVLLRLFKTYCCSFYGSQLWLLNDVYIDKLCISWNKGVRRILNLPYDTHKWLLGPLLNQYHIKDQFCHRTLRFISGLSMCNNSMVQACLENATHNANTPIGSNIAFFRYKFGVDILESDLKSSYMKIKPNKLDDKSESLLEVLNDLLLCRRNILSIECLSYENITLLINSIASL